MTIKTGKHPDYIVWSLRHEACKKCHGESKTLPCICGQQPCRNCGKAYLEQDHYDHGCNHCVKKEDAPKVIDVEECEYYILVACPYCKTSNLVEGHSSGMHPAADALLCYQCNKKAWLGVDTPYDYEDFINNDSVHTETGTPVSNG